MNQNYQPLSIEIIDIQLEDVVLTGSYTPGAPSGNTSHYEEGVIGSF